MAESILLLRVIKTIVGFLGIFGNALVCFVVFKTKAMHTTTNAFIFNQAVIDFMGSTMLLLGSNIPIPVPMPAGLPGDLLCKLWVSDFFLWAFLTVSTINLVFLTFERYFAIVFPFRYPIYYSRNKVVVMMTLTWCLGVFSSCYNIVIYANIEGNCVSLTIPGAQAVGVIIFFLQYLIPVVAILLAYVHITVVLKRGADRVGPQPTGQSVVEALDASLLRARRNTFKTLLIVFITYVVCWTMNSIIFFMFNFGYPLDFNGALYIVSVALVAINSCANPVIYAVKYRQFRQGFKKIFLRKETNVLNSDAARPVTVS
ncbi:galanin receptor 2b-like [Patiria miniata]|uniref:G-protein coupled receptors family 1 profile domain-containing protein n=1 Tax=Patiria miniata TaxID=46514 RepID=A0A913ZMU4_PATMI|nr:galanin receptor 2b-like [Patiria miniata]